METNILSDNLAGATSSAPSLRVEWFEDLADIERLEGAWRAIEGRVNDRTVFASWDHLVPWYHHYRGIYGEPLVGAAYRGDELVAVAPLVISRTTLGRIPVRQVDFAGYDGQSKASERGYPLEECHRQFMQENCERFGARGRRGISDRTRYGPGCMAGDGASCAGATAPCARSIHGRTRGAGEAESGFPFDFALFSRYRNRHR